MKELDVPIAQRLMARLVFSFPRFWIFMGNWETTIIKEKISNNKIVAPVYITGLARAGSTLLLEILATHPDVATNRYRDFPFLFTPYWWNKALDLFPFAGQEAVERAHQDKIMITPQSPEAMEEPIWMAFFNHLHNSAIDNRLDETGSNKEFEKYYRDNILKILLAQGKKRYLSKGNYNVTRIPYIAKNFPDARFVIPVRHPVTHVASLMRQHKRFLEGHARFPAAREQMRYSGHFEFGLDLSPINVGQEDGADALMKSEEREESVRGWARYWNRIYLYTSNTLEKSGSLREKTLTVRFEDICESPEERINEILDHCFLEEKTGIAESFSKKISAPSYYTPHFTEKERGIIMEETKKARKRFGY